MKKIKFINLFFTLGLRNMLFVASLFIATSTHAVIINADFSSGFAGWEGEILTDIGDDIGDITGTYPELFSVSGNSATIQTAVVASGPLAGEDAWFVSLSQDFMLDPVSAGSSLFLSMNLSDSADDFTAYLLNRDTGEDKELFSGAENNITNWIGANLRMVFTVEDFGGSGNSLGDSLTISNILFEERQSVPEPPLIFAVLFTALFLIRKSRLAK